MAKKHSSANPKKRSVGKDGPFPLDVAEQKLQAPPELCSAQYTATIVQVPDGGDEVFIEASGIHPSSGFEVFFQRSPEDVYPPQFSLWHVKPTGIVLDVMTPFSKFTGFRRTKEVEYVTVVDANGRHTVKVQKIGNALTMCK